ncbi:hypothetical protein CO2235_10366 [Cupriavidus oxalaticus]|uniref:Uncharacterized protein n=1 Tax=Cupriavidus oxalaticus TaxID=96344 RepID=A0A375FTZ4_9BURK|nr:hypothetical protein CO2235_10366 [Cupriavidus oxalaticus]
MREPDPPQRHAGAEGEVPAQAGVGRMDRRAGDERAQRRLRRGQHEAARSAEGRPLRAQRHQDVDHQRPGLRRAGGVRQDRARAGRARHDRLYRREGHEGLLGGAEAGQAGHARLAHRRAGVRGRGSAGGEHPRGRERRRQGADERAGLRARGAVGRPGRHHAGVHGRGHAVHPRPQAVRPEHRRVPADPGQGGGHVHHAAGGAQLPVHGRQEPGRARQRPRAPGAQGLRRGDPVHGREGHLDGGRDRADPGRQRLYQRVPGRAPVARRQAVRDRRRHLGDPPHADRPRTVRGNDVSGVPGGAGITSGAPGHPERSPEPIYNLTTRRKTVTQSPPSTHVPLPQTALLADCLRCGENDARRVRQALPAVPRGQPPGQAQVRGRRLAWAAADPARPHRLLQRTRARIERHPRRRI